MSINPLQPSEVEAWCRLMQIELTPWEAETLFKMDAAFLDRLTKKGKKSRISAKASADDPQAVDNLLHAFVHRKANGSMITRNGR